MAKSHKDALAQLEGITLGDVLSTLHDIEESLTRDTFLYIFGEDLGPELWEKWVDVCWLTLPHLFTELDGQNGEKLLDHIAQVLKRTCSMTTKEQMEKLNEPCEWEIVDVGVTIEYWKSGCGVAPFYTSPSDNDFTYCPYCGNPLIIVYHEGDWE